ncbi:MAG TPA: hypothetical protein VEK07_08830 [Polyangiaceae bacterium]|nr:hypothetical protein [Polyangiaceae bacterium]
MNDTTKVCVDAYGSAQEFRKNNDLLKARQALWTCAGAACPAIVQGDCTAWLSQVVDAIPSVVLEAKVDDDNVFDVSVSMDGAPIATQLDGKPVEINPGLHSFVFERPGAAPIEKKVIIAAHAKSQVIVAVWRPPPVVRAPASAPVIHPAAEAAPQTFRPVPPLAYVLGGVAVAALGTFAGLGLSGDITKHDLDTSCSPRCSSGNVSSLETRFLAADVALGVGAIAAASAVTVFFLRPEQPARALAVTAVGVAPAHGGAALQWSGSF